jgi:hypothetical protein
MILLPQVDSKENYLSGFWRWVKLLAERKYDDAFEALYWPAPTTWTAAGLERNITTLFGGPLPWMAIIPNDRLVEIVNGAAEYKPRGKDDSGWFLAQIPVTTSTADPKDDAIPLMGLTTSFFVRSYQDRYALSIEIFHA